MREPKVSIIIPVYNGEEYVEKAINSALKQTYKNIEIIVINDGSTDNTDEICKKYQDKVRYYKKENGGVSTVLNMAIEKMDGEYFSWLSHDDYYYPNKIEENVKAIEENTIIISDYGLIDENGHCYNKVVLSHEVIELHNEFALLKGFVNGITMLIPKKAFDDCGKFDVNLRCTQDYEMWFRMMKHGYKFKHIPKVLACTRIHSSQVTNTSPKVITEGNELWINMMEELSVDDKVRINNSEYNFYREMFKVLKETPYDDAALHAEKKMKEICMNTKIDTSDILVSVVMPFFDESKEVLKKAIDSVLKQSHRNTELILINDNPATYNKKFIESVSNDKRIVYIENPKNMGSSYSRNVGINLAKGKYIAFLDGDDEFIDNKIEIQLKELERCKENISHTSYYRFDGKTTTLIDSGKLTEFIYRQCIHHCTIATPTVMIKKEFLDKYQIRFDESIRIGEDTCFWLDILTKTSMVGIDKALTKVNTNDASAAYNIDKQIEGIGNIVKYVMERPIFTHYETETSAINNSYKNLLKSKENKNLSDSNWNPKVSIIIPVYNGENYIELAIDSALRQTYSNIEVIVVNDGSSDETDRICKKYGDKIKYIKKKNGGVSSALNVGIKNMTGDYFSWLSHDDLYFPEKVFAEIDYIKRNNLDETKTIIYSNYMYIDGSGEMRDCIEFNSTTLNRDSAYAILKGAINGLTLLIPRKAFDEVGLFDENLSCIQDYKLWFEMYKKGYCFTHISNTLAATRIHEKQVTNTNPKYTVEGNAFWMKTIESFDDSEKIRLYGSIYNYYYSMYKLFNGGVYDDTIKLCLNKCIELEENNKLAVKDVCVSVIIPFERNIDFCTEEINSVLNQTHQKNEIVLINNGYEGDTSQINELINNNNIIYIKNDTRQPISMVWNQGIDIASGKYIVFMKTNTLFDEKRIDVQLSKMIASGDMVTHMSYRKSTNNEIKILNTDYLSGYIVNQMMNENYMNLSTLMIEKSYLYQNNIRFKKEYEPAEETCFLLELLKDNPILCIDQVLTTVYDDGEEITDYKKRLNSIINCISGNEDLSKYKREYARVLYQYAASIYDHYDDGIDWYKKLHNEEIKRYAYMQTDECKNVKKIRSIFNKIRFKKTSDLYLLDTDSIMNSKLNKIYRKLHLNKEKKNEE